MFCHDVVLFRSYFNTRHFDKVFAIDGAHLSIIKIHEDTSLDDTDLIFTATALGIDPEDVKKIIQKTTLIGISMQSGNSHNHFIAIGIGKGGETKQLVKKVLQFAMRSGLELNSTKMGAIFDRGTALISAMKEDAPLTSVLQCEEHLCRNLDEHRYTVIKDSFRKVHQAHRRYEYEKGMEEVRTKSEKAYEYIKNMENISLLPIVEKGIVPFYGLRNSNFIEQLYSQTLKERRMALLFLLMGILEVSNKKIEEEREEARRWKECITPAAKNKYLEVQQKCGQGSMVVEVLNKASLVFSVKSRAHLHYSETVDLEKGTCTCLRPKQTMLPCRHMALCILYAKDSKNKIVGFTDNDLYSTKFFGLIYQTSNWKQLFTDFNITYPVYTDIQSYHLSNKSMFQEVKAAFDYTTQSDSKKRINSKGCKPSDSTISATKMKGQKRRCTYCLKMISIKTTHSITACLLAQSPERRNQLMRENEENQSAFEKGIPLIKTTSSSAEEEHKTHGPKVDKLATTAAAEAEKEVGWGASILSTARRIVFGGL